jgi:hypothetical protein
MFLAEGYLPSVTADGLALAGNMAAAASSRLASKSGQVRYVAAVFLPADQACLMIFEAVAAGDVTRACQRAGLPCERVTAAVVAGPVRCGDQSSASASG